MPRELVLHDGVLSVAVKSFETVELAQLEAENTNRESRVNETLIALGVVSPDDTEGLQSAARAHAEAKVAFEDSKSELQVGQGLVAQLPAQPEPEAVDSLEEGTAQEQPA